jgi:hypothetical protein
MDKKYLGDSYDLVKRFFCQVLSPIANLYAHPKFVPFEMRGSYTKVTTVPILPDTGPEGHFGILLDPTTGIPLPTGGANSTSTDYVRLEFIVDLDEKRHPDYMICFDQSHHRQHELDKKKQRELKMRFLHQSGLSSFYYVSHAPFLFVAHTSEALDHVFDLLISVGIPNCKFERCDISG